MNNALHAYRIKAVFWPIEIDEQGPATVSVEDALGQTEFWPLAAVLDRADELENFDRFAARMTSGETYLHPDDVAVWQEWSSRH